MPERKFQLNPDDHIASSEKRGGLRLAGNLPEIHSMGISVWDPIHAQRGHVGSCWEVVHIIKGSLKLHLNNKVFHGAPGDTLLIPAHSLHRDEFPPGMEFKVLHVMFKWPDAPALFTSAINRDLLRLPPVDKQTARELSYATYECFKLQRLMWREMTRACLYQLLLFLRSAGQRCGGGPRTAARADRRRQKLHTGPSRQAIDPCGDCRASWHQRLSSIASLQQGKRFHLVELPEHCTHEKSGRTAGKSEIAGGGGSLCRGL